jgi:hypothetical protein
MQVAEETTATLCGKVARCGTARFWFGIPAGDSGVIKPAPFLSAKGESIGCSSKVAVGGMTSRSRLPIRTICVGSRDMSRLVVQALVTRRSIPMRNEKFATAIVRAAAEPRI